MTLARHAPRSEIKLRERAYDVFTEQLLRSEIKPGQFVTQRELVALTGQSLGAIRELIPRLEAEGLIVTVPQRGLQILPLDITLIRNAFHSDDPTWQGMAVGQGLWACRAAVGGLPL